MERMESSYVCSSVGMLNKEEYVCRGAGELQCAWILTAVTPSIPSSIAFSLKAKNSLSSGLHWPEEWQLCYLGGFPGRMHLFHPEAGESPLLFMSPEYEVKHLPMQVPPKYVHSGKVPVCGASN